MDEIIYDEWVKKAAKPGHITVIIGRKGSGKSGQGYRITEDIHSIANKDVYILGLPESAKKLLPKSFIIVDDILEVPNGSCVFVDEAAIHFSSKDWYKKGHGELAKLIEIARHKELSLVFVTLNTASVDVNVLRFVDSVLFKPLSLLQLELERQQMKKIIAEAQQAFLEGVPEGEDERAYTYVIGDKERGMMKTELPSFWSDDLSTSYESFMLREDEDEWEVPVLMGGKAGQGSQWACEDCIYWQEPKDEDGWCSLGFGDAPRRRCEARVRPDNKPKKILGKRDVKIKKNPQPAPLVNLTQITIAHNEVPEKEAKTVNKKIVEIAGPKENPPRDAPGPEVYLCRMKELCSLYLNNPKDLKENLRVLKSEVDYNRPLEDPDYDKFGRDLDRLIEFKSKPQQICGALPNPKHQFQKGDFVRTKGQTLYLVLSYDEEYVHYWLSKEEKDGPVEISISPETVYQIEWIKKGYFGLLVPAAGNGVIGCFGTYDPISIDGLKYFEKISAGEVAFTKVEHWQKRLEKIKTEKEWTTFTDQLESARKLFHQNFVFEDIERKVLIPDPLLDKGKGSVFYTVPLPNSRIMTMKQVEIKDITKKVRIINGGCEAELGYEERFI